MLKKFVMRTLEGMYASDENEYKVRKFALNWYNKDVLDDEDLITIDSWYAVETEETVTDNVTEQEEGE